MKLMRCKELGGACEEEFRAETFKEMAELSRAHGMKMAEQKDVAHLKAMDKMREMMQDPKAINKWMKDREAMFDESPTE